MYLGVGIAVVVELGEEKELTLLYGMIHSGRMSSVCMPNPYLQARKISAVSKTVIIRSHTHTNSSAYQNRQRNDL